MQGEKILKYDLSPSTSLKAKELALQGCSPWTVVIAKAQSSGHGTKGSDWFSPEGGLYFSVVLPSANIKDLQIITILTAFVVASTVKNNFNLEPMIKLPNDVFVNGKKFCGILTENVIIGDIINPVIGVGVNTNIDKFSEELLLTATSISKECGAEVDNQKILDEIVSGLKLYFKKITN